MKMMKIAARVALVGLSHLVGRNLIERPPLRLISQVTL
jgi:hypothetical protein